jgi:sugar phosphate isomerase/epimerase
MRLGLFTPVFGYLSFDDMLTAVKALGVVEAIEIGTGGWPGSAHLDVEGLLASGGRAREYRQRVADAGLTISALSCHGNPIHPDAAQARDYDETFRRTVLLAERLQVPVVVTFSGCPGDSDEAKHPNWITCAWPPEFSERLAWQWDQKVVPYWMEAGRFAADHGVNVAIEAHPGFVVYNVETALTLRARAGNSIGVNFDPSHFFWQGMDAARAIEALGSSIFHMHAKDVALHPGNVATNGVLDTKSYTRMAERSWIFRSVGWGHDESEWKRIISALRLVGYDYVVSIEHEDALASVDEGLRAAVSLLDRIILKAPPVTPWWT